MILTPSAEKHEAYAKRRKINPMPNAGTRILYEARENMNLMRSAGKQMRCQTREKHEFEAKLGKMNTMPNAGNKTLISVC